MGAGLAGEVTRATLLLLICHIPSPWLPATAMGPELASCWDVSGCGLEPAFWLRGKSC